MRSWLLILFISYFTLEVCSFIGLRALTSFTNIRYKALPFNHLPDDVEAQLDQLLDNNFHRYLAFDPVLGWSIKPNGTNKLYRANAQGFRAMRNYSLLPQKGIVRISTFGDSFTHGDDVAIENTWQVKLEELITGSEVLNFGVPAYGPGQAYLRYREFGHKFKAHIVLICFMTENIFRSINVFRPFYRTEYAFPLAKPRFTMRNNRLELIPNPMPSLDHYRNLKNSPESTLRLLGEHDLFFENRYRASIFDISPFVRIAKLTAYEFSLYRSSIVFNSTGVYDTSTEAFAVVTGILNLFRNEIHKNGAIPVVMVFPQKILGEGDSQTKVYEPLLEWLTEQGISYIDAQNAFDKYGKNIPLSHLTVGDWQHYSPTANKMIARYLQDWLDEGPLKNIHIADGRRSD